MSTKVHVLCDGRGNPMTAVLSPGQSHESKLLPGVLEAGISELNEEGFEATPAKLAGDKGYRYEWIDDYLLEKEINPVIASKSNEDRSARKVEFDKPSYRRRCVIEQLIGWLKEARRVATRYEKLAVTYLSMVKLAMIARYLRQFAPEGSRI